MPPGGLGDGKAIQAKGESGAMNMAELETGNARGWRAKRTSERPKSRRTGRKLTSRIGRKRRIRQKNVEMALRYKGLL